VCWVLSRLAHLINENESGSWLPTPTANSYGNNQSASSGAKIRPSLHSMASANLWPTHKSKNHKGARTTGTARQKWPTPLVHDAKAPHPSDLQRQSPGLFALVGGPLNPMWVEWLMGWPLGWTDLAPLAMGKFPSVLPSPGIPYFEEWLALTIESLQPIAEPSPSTDPDK
jgi:hypothetical protein